MEKIWVRQRNVFLGIGFLGTTDNSVDLYLGLAAPVTCRSTSSARRSWLALHITSTSIHHQCRCLAGRPCWLLSTFRCVLFPQKYREIPPKNWDKNGMGFLIFRCSTCKCAASRALGLDSLCLCISETLALMILIG